MYGFGELVICEDESEVGGRSGMKLFGKALVVVMVLGWSMVMGMGRVFAGEEVKGVVKGNGGEVRKLRESVGRWEARIREAVRAEEYGEEMREWEAKVLQTKQNGVVGVWVVPGGIWRILMLEPTEREMGEREELEGYFRRRSKRVGWMMKALEKEKAALARKLGGGRGPR